MNCMCLEMRILVYQGKYEKVIQIYFMINQQINFFNFDICIVTCQINIIREKINLKLILFLFKFLSYSYYILIFI